MIDLSGSVVGDRVVDVADVLVVRERARFLVDVEVVRVLGRTRLHRAREPVLVIGGVLLLRTVVVGERVHARENKRVG